MRRHIFLFLFLLLLGACHRESPPPQIGPPLVGRDTLSILALGDSYTKGQGVPWGSNFPNQLRDSLLAEGITTEATDPIIVAQTGWRTDQLLAAYRSQPNLSSKVVDLVTLCIGVNNQFQNRNQEEYQQELEELLQIAIERTGNRPERVLVVSIPDWAFTPFGQNYPGFGGPFGITSQVDQFNELKRSSALAVGASYVYITDLSREGLEKPDWVASDGLHPSEAQYSAWLSKRILPVIRTLLDP